MRKFCLLLVAAIAFVACDTKEPTPQEGLKLLGDQTTELHFEGFASSENITFYAPVNWMIEMNEDIEWFKLSPMYGGAGDKSLCIEVYDYDGETTLEGSFAIVAGDQRIEFTVTQLSCNDPNSEFVYIEDENLEKFLVKHFDTNANGRIERTEAEVVKGIDCSDQGIRSMVGIKAFTSLEMLDCSYNQIDGVLDLSGMESLKEAYVDHNLYTSLNLTGCKNLAIVEANDNVERTESYTSIFRTTSIDLTGCNELIYLELTDNAISEIDLTHCPKLQVLRMTWNALTSIDVTQNPELTHLYVRKNPDLAGTIDLSNNTKLQEVWCAESKVQGLNLTNDHSALTKIVSYYSDIEALDLSTCPNLTYLEAHGMKLTSIDLTQCSKLDYLWLKFNEIGELDLTNCPDIQEVQIGYNKLTSLDMSKCSNIKLLEVAANLLTDINLKGCTKLESLDVSANQLTTLDIQDSKKLFSASVSENQITTLDISGMEELVVLNCSYNSLTNINTTGCRDLRWLYADNNKLTHLDLRANSAIEELALTNNELVELQVSGLKALSLCEFNNNNLERLDLSGCTSIYELYVHDNPLAYFSAYDCAALYQIDIRRTAMKSIDLSKNKNVAFIFAEENPQLETIYIHPEAPINTISCDEHVMVYYYDAKNHDDVNNGNWGDEDLDPWQAA